MVRCLPSNVPICGDRSSNPCRDCNPNNFKDLDVIMTCFKRKWSEAIKDEWGYYRSKKVSDKTLQLASRAALDDSEKKHCHQHRVPDIALAEAEKIILSLINIIKKQKSFDELHELIIKEVQNVVRGFGPMSSYDTAARIGMMLNLEPEYVYLHAGTAQGARGVLGEAYCNGKTKLAAREFPAVINNSGFKPDQIESFLCICKKPLNTLK